MAVAFIMNLQNPPQSSNSLVGNVRRFGPHGVLYEVLRIIDDRQALIRVIDTGEEATYSLASIFADPQS